MTLRRILVAVAAVLVVLVAFVGGVVVGGHAQATGLTRLSDPLRGILLGDSGEDLNGQVLDVLESDYYEPVDATKLERTSVQAMIDSLGDPYTDYLDPDELEALRERNEGAYYGVGLQVAPRGRAVVITRVFDDSPAAEAGIRAGDRLVTVEGRPVAGPELEAAIARIRGPKDTTVTLGVARGDGPPREYELRRERITVPPVTSRVETVDGTKIGYVQLAQFTKGAADAMRDAVEALREKGVTAIVLDLRGDPGGLVNEAVGVAGVFLPDDSPVVVTQGLHSPRREFTTDGDPAAGDLPLIVLVNRGSASASEIVAGALRDADRGELVGERTFGKALVQSTRPLRDGGALKLTTARYLTPDGFDLAKRGLPPDVRVVDDPATARDEALQRGLALAAATP
ncbi:MAG TPA: S41 family peptidase [Miltoncostaeaceae bacterium]|jgi:carboxyl-terminal processing protease|nr:S41 family peptidase [Miltoncostaeaceae bacterium]